MPSVVIDNTAQVRLIWGLSGSDFAVNVLHGIKQDPLMTIDQNRVNDLADDIKVQWLASPLAGLISSTIGIASVGLRDINSPNNVEFVKGLSGAAGSNATEILPLNVALCCTLRTNKAGRSYRGRYYQSGWTENSNMAGFATGEAQGSLTDWIGRLRTAFDDNGLELAVASRTLGKANAVTAWTTRDQRWDTQRRRIVPGI